jgi:hypothetical protein
VRVDEHGQMSGPLFWGAWAARGVQLVGGQSQRSAGAVDVELGALQ